jgi:hypothetical protein
LAQFNNDTISFVRYNFDTRAACYVGKTLNDVQRDLGIAIKSYLPFYGQDADLYVGAYVYIYSMATVDKFLDQKQARNFIAITWATPIPDNELNTLRVPDHYAWTPQIANFLLNRTIKEIGVVRDDP